MLTDEARQFFRAQAAKRQQFAGACAVCHTPIVGLATKRYCSRRCQRHAFNYRRLPPSSPPR